MLSSADFRQWLLPQLKGKTQAQAAAWLGIAQSTINRMLHQKAYDFPLDTVARIGRVFGHDTLSAFVLHLENIFANDQLRHSAGVTSAPTEGKPVAPQRKPLAKGVADAPAARSPVHDDPADSIRSFARTLLAAAEDANRAAESIKSLSTTGKGKTKRRR